MLKQVHVSEKIYINNISLNLSMTEIQTTPKGLKIRYSGLKQQNTNWIYSFVILETKQILNFEFDSYGNYKKNYIE